MLVWSVICAILRNTCLSRSFSSHASNSSGKQCWAKLKNTARQKIGTSSLTACSQHAHKCSQHAHSMLTNGTRPFKHQSNGPKIHWHDLGGHSMLTAWYWSGHFRSNSFKFIQNPVNFLHLSPDWYLTGYHSMSFKFSSVKLPQVDSNRSNFHHHLVVKFTKIFILTI